MEVNGHKIFIVNRVSFSRRMMWLDFLAIRDLKVIKDTIVTIEEHVGIQKYAAMLSN